MSDATWRQHRKHGFRIDRNCSEARISFVSVIPKQQPPRIRMMQIRTHTQRERDSRWRDHREAAVQTPQSVFSSARRGRWNVWRKSAEVRRSVSTSDRMSRVLFCPGGHEWSFESGSPLARGWPFFTLRIYTAELTPPAVHTRCCDITLLPLPLLIVSCLSSTVWPLGSSGIFLGCGAHDRVVCRKGMAGVSLPQDHKICAWVPPINCGVRWGYLSDTHTHARTSTRVSSQSISCTEKREVPISLQKICPQPNCYNRDW